MSQRLLPTTRPQVSGHRFMQRRVEHGLIYGDIRMIHDPLAARRRAGIFGAVGVVLIAAVMGLFAWMSPNPHPGEAPIVRATDGGLFVRVDGTLHPVTNLTSARLIAGEAAEPARAGGDYLATVPRGLPVGIVAAPGMFAPEATEAHAWSACHTEGKVTVVAGQAPAPLPRGTAVLAVADHREWVVDAHGRRQLPPSTTPEGRIMRRALGIDATTPRWSPPNAVLGALREGPAFTLPPRLPEVLRTPEATWVLTEHGGVQQVSDTAAQVLLDAGAASRDVNRADIAHYPDAQPPLDLRIPHEAPRWVQPTQDTVCVNDKRGAATWPKDAGGVLEGAIALAGTGTATHFAGLREGAVGVDTGQGLLVVSPEGARHEVAGQATLELIGVRHTEEAPWQIVALLPAGAPLERSVALKPVAS
ncbi:MULTISPECIES: type VII secretion protein EccB [Corynebacterium]|uniref:Type VII secretion protein EccB n=1 Tax=Corynebacterium pseudogenitalium TaxID=38303 RepID=A0ABD4TNM2_9CORY|nr:MULTISPECIES: type VII secretion protein EccB [Corynebacterium]MCQ4606868.1 type VII secretion protein EccB [Corynebacterium pseudogenitalium]MCQ4613930.1 type VII secretion protein EccB [Corynebacterium pseudogenitalium]OFT31148.1 hypothetical protein HMPREF3170_02765 [Corynebacterium sp. HMSC08D02]